MRNSNLIGTSRSNQQYNHSQQIGETKAPEMKHMHSGGVKIRTTIMSRDPKKILAEAKAKFEVERIESPKRENADPEPKMDEL